MVVFHAYFPIGPIATFGEKRKKVLTTLIHSRFGFVKQPGQNSASWCHKSEILEKKNVFNLKWACCQMKTQI